MERKKGRGGRSITTSIAINTIYRGVFHGSLGLSEPTCRPNQPTKVDRSFFERERFLVMYVLIRGCEIIAKGGGTREQDRGNIHDAWNKKQGTEIRPAFELKQFKRIPVRGFQ